MHEGHRQRLRKRYLNEGLDHFEPVNVLELLLTYAIPRKDTNVTAHLLLQRFGNFKNVLEAPFSELLKVDGISENAAVLIFMVKDLFRYYGTMKTKAPPIVHSVEAAGELLLPKFIGLKDEVVYALFLDGKGALLSCKKLFEGSVSSAQVSIRKIVEDAIFQNASAVVLGHNHPGGMAIPSSDDILATREIKKALEMIDVRLVDHMVFADDDFVSLKDSGMLK